MAVAQQEFGAHAWQGGAVAVNVAAFSRAVTRIALDVEGRIDVIAARGQAEAIQCW